MATAYSRNLVDKILPKIQQYEATTGRKVSRSMMDSLFRQELDALGQQDLQSRALELQQQNIESDRAFRDRQLKDQNKAAAISGVAQIGQAYGTYKLASGYLNKPSGVPAVGDASATTGGYAGGNTGMGPAFTEAPVGAQTAASGAAPTTTAIGGQSAISGASASEAAAGSGMGEGLAATYGEGYGAGATTAGAAEGTAGAGAGSSVGVAGPAIAAAYVGTYGPGLLKKATGMNDVWSKGLIRGPESFLGSAATHVAGETVGRIIDPVGFIGDKIADSVICSELVRQNRISERDRTKCVVFRFRNIPDDLFVSYLEWAKPHVTAMRKGGWRNTIRLPFAHAFVGFMLAMQTGKKTTLFQKVVWKWAWYRCSKIAQRNEYLYAEVA
jgi:hypothetical protein